MSTEGLAVQGRGRHGRRRGSAVAAGKVGADSANDGQHGQRQDEGRGDDPERPREGGSGPSALPSGLEVAHDHRPPGTTACAQRAGVVTNLSEIISAARIRIECATSSTRSRVRDALTTSSAEGDCGWVGP